jgi:hypothetical protein
VKARLSAGGDVLDLGCGCGVLVAQSAVRYVVGRRCISRVTVALTVRTVRGIPGCSAYHGCGTGAFTVPLTGGRKGGSRAGTALAGISHEHLHLRTGNPPWRALPA